MIRSLPIATATLAALLALSGCGLHRIDGPTRPADDRVRLERMPHAPQPTPAPSMARPTAPPPRTPALSAIDRDLLARAQQDYERASQTIPQWPDAAELGRLLTMARNAATAGDAVTARRLATTVLNRSGAALDVQFRLMAEVELQKSQTYTGLSNAQIERQRRAELLLTAGRGREAHELLSRLNHELAEATKRYVVAAGDSLWIISGRPEIYGNPWLWPLIWEANLDRLDDPQKLFAGQRLKIRSNPTIDDVVKALDTAHRYATPRVRIGEIREADTPPAQ